MFNIFPIYFSDTQFTFSNINIHPTLKLTNPNPNWYNHNNNVPRQYETTKWRKLRTLCINICIWIKSSWITPIFHLFCPIHPFVSFDCICIIINDIIGRCEEEVIGFIFVQFDYCFDFCCFGFYLYCKFCWGLYLENDWKWEGEDRSIARMSCFREKERVKRDRVGRCFLLYITIICLSCIENEW